MSTKTDTIVAPFVAVAPPIFGKPDPANRLRRFLKFLARRWQIRVEWDAKPGTGIDGTSKEQEGQSR